MSIIERKKSYRSIAFILMIALVITMMPIMSFANDGDGGSDDSIAVQFIVDGNVHETFTSGSGLTLVEDQDAPENNYFLCDQPKAPNAKDWPENAVAFRGWFENETPGSSESPFDFSTPITGDKALYAVFSKEYLVSFCDNDGKVILSRILTPGQVIYGPDQSTIDKVVPPNKGDRLVGWYDVDDPDQTLVNFNDPNFKPTRDMKFKPYFDSYYSVMFVSEGTQVEPEMAKYGTTAQKPADPTRAGYTFTGWRLGSKTGPAYNFTELIEDDIVLYSTWSANMVDITVAIWMEKPNMFGVDESPSYAGGDKSGYNYVKSVKLEKYAFAGTIASVDGDTAGIKELFAPGSSQHALLKYAEYQGTDDNVTVLGNGKTVINLYATRTVYTYTFDLWDTTTRTENRVTLSNNNPNGTMTIGGTTYVNTSASADKYVMRAKYEQDISRLFPVQGVDFVTFASGTGTNSNRSFQSWNISNSGMSESANARMSRILSLDASLIAANGQQKQYNLMASWGTGDPYTYRYLVEKLPEQSIGGLDTIAYGTKTYVVMDDYSQSVTSNLVQKNLVGLKRIDYRWTYSNTEYQWKPYTYNASNRTFTAANNNSSALTDASYIRCFFYDRLQYDLEFDMMVPDDELDKLGNVPENEKLMYQQSLKGYEPEKVPTRDGYKFVGWYRDSNSPEVFDFNITMPNSDTKVYARWESTDCEVTFLNSKGGDVFDVQGVAKGESAIDKNSEPTPYYRENEFYQGKGIFKGWVHDLGSNVIAPFSFEMPIYKDYTVYAKWQTSGFEINYDLDGGTGYQPVDEYSYDLGTTARVLDTNATKGESIFYAWKLGNKIYYPGNFIDMSTAEGLTLVAQYAPRTELFDVTYHMNGPNGESDTLTIRIPKSAEAIDLAGEIFKITGTQYKLMGWSNESGNDNNKDYDLSSNYTLTEADKDGNRIFYGVWNDVGWTVEFLPGTDGSLTGETKYENIPDKTSWDDAFGDDARIIPSVTPNSGYKFVRWEPNFPTSIEENLTFTAQYTPIYKIMYRANTGTGTMADQDAPFGEAVTLNENEFSKVGYSFTGWNTEADGTGTAYTDMEKFLYEIQGDLTLYAQWTPNAYDITYVYEGDIPTGVNLPAKESNVPYGAEKTVASDPYAEGYIFSGWTTEDVTVVEDGFIMPDNDVVFVGSWEIRTDLSATIEYYQDTMDESGYMTGKDETIENLTYNSEFAITKELRDKNLSEDYMFNSMDPRDGVITIEVEGNIIKVLYTKGEVLPEVADPVETGGGEVLGEISDPTPAPDAPQVLGEEAKTSDSMNMMLILMVLIAAVMILIGTQAQRMMTRERL